MCRPIFNITCSHKHCQIKYAHACFHFLVRNTWRHGVQIPLGTVLFLLNSILSVVRPWLRSLAEVQHYWVSYKNILSRAAWGETSTICTDWAKNTCLEKLCQLSLWLLELLVLHSRLSQTNASIWHWKDLADLGATHWICLFKDWLRCHLAAAAAADILDRSYLRKRKLILDCRKASKTWKDIVCTLRQAFLFGPYFFWRLADSICAKPTQ